MSPDSICLINSKNSDLSDEYLLNETLPGQYFTANDQCQMVYGLNASLCQVVINLKVYFILLVNICSILIQRMFEFCVVLVVNFIVCVLKFKGPLWLSKSVSQN